MSENKKISIDIDHSRDESGISLGWILVTFRTISAEITIHVSDVFQSALHIISIFLGVMNGYIPQEIEIDEEGEIKVLSILPGHDNIVIFQIKDYDYGEPYNETNAYPNTYIDIEIDKDELVTEMFKSYIYFLENRFNQDKWREDNVIKNFLDPLKKHFASYLEDKSFKGQ